MGPVLFSYSIDFIKFCVKKPLYYVFTKQANPGLAWSTKVLKHVI